MRGSRHVELMEGEQLELECNTEVDPGLEDSLAVTWSHNGTDLGVAGRQLRVETVTPAEAGLYRCRAATRADSATSRPAAVSINGQ